VFLRSVKAANGRHEYLRLVENYREEDKIRQRVVLHVGRKDLLAPHLDALVRLLQADQPAPAWSRQRKCLRRRPGLGDPLWWPATYWIPFP
jgi:hypothetical protein